MGISVRWHDTEQTIQIFEVKSPWTVSDLYEAIEAGYELTQHKDYFDIIYDLRNSHSIPTNFRTSISYMARMKQPQVGIRVVVGMGRIIPLVMNLIKVFKPDLITGVILANTFDEALKKIDTYRSDHLKDCC